MWNDAMTLPSVAGKYLVANDKLQYVAMARFLPRKMEWKFPSAAQAFPVTHWGYLPEPPDPKGDDR